MYAQYFEYQSLLTNIIVYAMFIIAAGVGPVGKYGILLKFLSDCLVFKLGISSEDSVFFSEFFQKKLVLLFAHRSGAGFLVFGKKRLMFECLKK